MSKTGGPTLGAELRKLGPGEFQHLALLAIDTQRRIHPVIITRHLLPECAAGLRMKVVEQHIGFRNASADKTVQ